IFSSRIHWPALHFRKTVSGGEAHGVLDTRVVPDAHGSIVPPIESMAHVASISELDMLLEHRRAWTQDQFHSPFHSVDSIDVPNDDRRTAIRLAGVGEIHRRHRNPIVRNG